MSGKARRHYALDAGASASASRYRIASRGVIAAILLAACADWSGAELAWVVAFAGGVWPDVSAGGAGCVVPAFFAGTEGRVFVDFADCRAGGDAGPDIALDGSPLADVWGAPT